MSWIEPFTLDGKQLADAQTFTARHKHRKEYTISYAFFSNGIAGTVHIHCSCGKSKDLTDYENW